MVKQHETNKKPWGTLEELLLASAVNRHGTNSWDTVAMELHKRCSQSPSSLNPQDCRNKFYDLKRRFISENDDDSDSLMQMLDELRKNRVEELRRDVQQRDVLIVSLEMKVKRLEEERAQSCETVPIPDLDGQAEKRNSSSKNHDDKTVSVSGDDSDDRENRSLTESNSTSKKFDVRQQNGVVEEKTLTDSVKLTNKKTGSLRTGAEPGREWSLDDGMEAEKEKEKETNWAKASQAGGLGDSNDAWESVSESKQEGKVVSKQQSSDVQSSGSLSQRKRCRNRANSSGEEPEGDEVSPAKDRLLAVKSEPLVKFLETIWSHRLGSAFKRRLRSQESDTYKKVIREHMDLKAIRSRVVKGFYADSIHRFFRDLLLIFSNAVIFFHKSSPEYVASVNLRALVLQEIEDELRNLGPVVVKSEAKPEVDLLTNSKPTAKSSTSSLIGCRKRDSVSVGSKKSEKNSTEQEDKKPQPGKDGGGDQKNNKGSSEIKIYEKGTWKKGMKEKSRPSSNVGPIRSSRTSKSNGEVKHEYGGNELSSHDAMEMIQMEKKDHKVIKKKQGAASFLKRMKQNSPSEATDEEEEDQDISEEEEAERKVVTRSGRGGGGGGGGGRRGVGRPPKKAEPVKRRREEEVAAGSGGGGKARKRSRR